MKGLGKQGFSRAARKQSASGFSRCGEGGSNSVVESQPSKLLVAGSIPVSRSRVESFPGWEPAAEIPDVVSGCEPKVR